MLGLGCATPGPSPAPTTPSDGLEIGELTRVHDGDSGLMRIGNLEVEIRLQGVNAPEQGECFHAQARARLEEIQGRAVQVQVVGSDQFGRNLAYLRLDGTLLNAELAAGGFAIATTPEPGDPDGEAIIAAEWEAATAGRGLWAADACPGSGPVAPVSVLPGLSRFDPPGPDEEAMAEEQVTLGSETVVELDGWTVRDESSAHRCRLPAGVVTGPGRVLTITSDDGCWEPGGSPVWNNGGDLVLVLDAAGTVAGWHRYRR